MILATTLWLSAALPAAAWEIIDVPTAEPIDYSTYRLGFRLYGGGGILTRATFGVFRNVNLGFAWDVKNIIGENNVELVPPSIHLKIRFYEGDKKFPAFAIGYEAQGHYWDKAEQQYAEKERGIYMVATREMFTPGLEFSLGGNVNDFKKSVVHGFAGAEYDLDTVSFLLEYDNLPLDPLEKNQRLNAGLRFKITPDLHFELAGKNIGRNSPAERIIKSNYIARF